MYRMCIATQFVELSWNELYVNWMAYVLVVMASLNRFSGSDNMAEGRVAAEKDAETANNRLKRKSSSAI